MNIDKLLINTFYPLSSTPYIVIYDPIDAEETTRIGKKILKELQTQIENHDKANN